MNFMGKLNFGAFLPIMQPRQGLRVIYWSHTGFLALSHMLLLCFHVRELICPRILQSGMVFPQGLSSFPHSTLSCAFLKSHCEYPLLGPADLGGFPRLCSPLHVQIWKTQEEFREGWFRSGSRRIPLGPVSGKDRQDTQEEEKRLKALSAEAELGLETP